MLGLRPGLPPLVPFVSKRARRTLLGPEQERADRGASVLAVRSDGSDGGNG
jgi:hypothetical protein